jgi:hypothetical protein
MNDDTHLGIGVNFMRECAAAGFRPTDFPHLGLEIGRFERTVSGIHRNLSTTVEWKKPRR